jgi:glycosyltransferase involved in cell wall biosynthesis
MNPLRIGINAIFRGKPTGVANYLIHLVNEISRIDHENEYFVFVTDHNNCWFTKDNPNFHYIVCSVNPARPIVRRLWELTVFPGIVNKHNLNILHCPINILPAFIKCPSIVTFVDCQYFHQPSQNNLLRRYFNKVFMRLSAHRAEAILTISNSVKDDILRYLGAKEESIYTTHLGQDFSDVPRDEKKIESLRQKLSLTRKYLLFVGFPQYRKNLVRLTKAFGQACSRLDETIDLVICGDLLHTKGESDYLNTFKAAAEAGVQDRLKFINYLERSDLHTLITGAEVFTFPSVYEGFGLPVLEAMACGTAVMVSDIPVMHEIAGDAGFYVNPYDTNDIASGIETLLKNHALRRCLSAKGTVIACRFTWHDMARKTLVCYKNFARRSR